MNLLSSGSFSYLLQTLRLSDFLSSVICYEDEFGKDDKIVVFCSRLNSLVTDQWLLIRLLDMDGKASGTSMLAKFTISSVG